MADAVPGLSKRLERYLKLAVYCRCSSAGGMSVVEPAVYARRFTRMVERIVGLGAPSEARGAGARGERRESDSSSTSW